jgi:signal transduction histidine kinase
MSDGEQGSGGAEAWLRVSSEVISGVHHALNNRLGALSAVAQVLEAEMGSAHPLRSALVQEVDRLQATVRSLTLLPRREGASAEPVHLPDLLPSVVELFELHHGVRDTDCVVEGEGAVLPLYCEPNLLAHLLLTLLVAEGERARAAGTRVVLRYSGDDARVRVAIGAEGATEDGRDAMVAALRGGVGELGGEVAAGGGGYELTLPTLPDVRRREREG